jgi:hypothetical protein
MTGTERIDTLIEVVEALAKRTADGHLTILRFETGWKAALGTPDGRHDDDQETIGKLPAAATMQAALVDLLRREIESFAA